MLINKITCTESFLKNGLPFIWLPVIWPTAYHSLTCSLCILLTLLPYCWMFCVTAASILLTSKHFCVSPKWAGVWGCVEHSSYGQVHNWLANRMWHWFWVHVKLMSQWSFALLGPKEVILWALHQGSSQNLTENPCGDNAGYLMWGL